MNGITHTIVKYLTHPFFLHFTTGVEERAYHDYSLPMIGREARAGLVVAILCWFCYALLEPMLLPKNLVLPSTILSVVAIGVGLLVYGLTYTRFFVRYQQAILLLSGISAMLVLSIKMLAHPEFAIAHLFPAVLLVTIWNFILSGLRFVYAFAAGIVFVLVFIVWFLIAQHVPSNVLINNGFYALTAFVLGAMTSYTHEKQNRKLFVKKQMLDAEKERHLHRALHDPLTKLPNRDLLEDRLEQAISLSSRTDIISAGIYIDLDKFKTINDKYGHLVGDLYLKEITSRLKDITRQTDTLARIGGDEFFLLMLDVQDEEAALVLSRKIQDNLSEYFILADKIKLKGLGASVGVCMLPYQHCTPNDIINRADKAMYQMKYLGKTLAAA